MNQKISLQKSNKINSKIPTIEDKSIEELIPNKIEDNKLKSIEANSQSVLPHKSLDNTNSFKKIIKNQEKLSNPEKSESEIPNTQPKDEMIEQKIKLKLNQNNPLKIDDDDNTKIEKSQNPAQDQELHDHILVGQHDEKDKSIAYEENSSSETDSFLKV